MTSKRVELLLEYLANLEPPPEDPERVAASERRIRQTLEDRGLLAPSTTPASRSAEVVEPSLAGDRPGRRLRTRLISPRFGWAVAAVVLLVGVVLVATPSGEALARWFGGLLDFGEPGGAPTLDVGEARQVRDPFAWRAASYGDVGVVLRTGTVAGYQVELTSSRSESGAFCFGVEFPEQDARLGSCPDRPGGRSVLAAPVVDHIARDIPGMDGVSVIVGRAPSTTASLRVVPASPGSGTRRQGAPRQARRSPLPYILADPRQVTPAPAWHAEAYLIFAALLPRRVDAVRVIAIGRDGRRLGARRFRTDLSDRDHEGIVHADQSNR